MTRVAVAEQRGAPAHVFVVFGATGDLARRELLPAIWRLQRGGKLGTQHVLGVSRDPEHDDRSYRAWVREALEAAGARDLAAWCDGCVHYQRLDAREPDGYGELGHRIEGIEHAAGLPGNRVFCLALPPGLFPSAVEGLGRAGLARGEGFTRLVVEKPFGRDVESARELNALVQRRFDESRVYRIDHFLGKETVQNLLVLRCANAVLEALWNRDHVDEVQITVAEDGGIGSRSGYFDDVGALRDMVQNHLLQILCLVAMEVPAAYEADAIRAEKVELLRAVRAPDPQRAVLGRYARGRIDGEVVPGYLDEPGVPADSDAETYVALELSIDNPRWRGVPFRLRTGKRLARRTTEVAVAFRRPSVGPLGGLRPDQDVLFLRLQPDEGFELRLDVKRPGESIELEEVGLGSRYAERFGELSPAYATLLLDVLHGDPTLFVGAREVELAWELCRPLLEGPRTIHDYPAGSWGPRRADELLERQGRAWRTA